MELNTIDAAFNRLLDALDAVIIILLGLAVFCIVMSIISFCFKWKKWISAVILICLIFFVGLTILAAYYQNEIKYIFIHEEYYQSSDSEKNTIPEHNENPKESTEPETDIGELISTETVYVDENNYIIVSVFEDKYLLRDYVIYGCFEGTDLSNEYGIFAYLTAEIFDRGLNGTMVWVSGEDSIVYSLENGTRFTYFSEDFTKYENVEMDISPELCLEIENVFDRIEEINY